MTRRNPVPIAACLLLLAWGAAAARAQSAVFVHTATAANSGDGLTVLDHPMLNGDATARILVTHFWNPPGVAPTYHPSAVEVYYSPILLLWVIESHDGVMPLGSSFFVYARKAFDLPNGAIQEHSAAEATIVGQTTYLDHPGLNGFPTAPIQVQPARAAGSPSNPHNVGAWYNTLTGRWGIFNQDLADMTVHTRFFVGIGPLAAPFAWDASFVHTGTDETTTSGWTYLPLTDPKLALFVTSIWNQPGIPSGVYNDHPIGVWYDALNDLWSIFNEDEMTMPVGAHFQVHATLAFFQHGFENGALTGWSAWVP